jgi:hypothetical protein
MESISRGPTFGDFVTIRTEGSMQDVSDGCKTTEYKSITDSPFPTLLNVMYCVRVSLLTVKIFLAQHEKVVVGDLYISLAISNDCKKPGPSFHIRAYNP